MSELTDNPMLPIEQRLEIAIGGRDYFKQCHKNARQRVEALEAENAALSAVVERQREALKGLADHVDSQTCRHETTRQVGAIWSVCEDCGYKWDDSQGAPAVEMPMPLINALSALTLTPAAALRLHQAGVLDGIASEMRKLPQAHVSIDWLVHTLREDAARLRAGGEG